MKRGRKQASGNMLPAIEPTPIWHVKVREFEPQRGRVTTHTYIALGRDVMMAAVNFGRVHPTCIQIIDMARRSEVKPYRKPGRRNLNYDDI